MRDVIARRVALRYKLASRPEVATLWYENEAGDKFVPDLSVDGYPYIPKNYGYQWSQFPRQLRETCLKIVSAEEVEACGHPAEGIVATGGWIDGVEGRECKACMGTQTRNDGEKWAPKWDSGRSYQVMAGTSGWSDDLVLAMVRPSLGERESSLKGYGSQPHTFSMDDAILLSARSCEACLNSLAHRYGLKWGYERGGEDWSKCGTSCFMCEAGEETWDWLNAGTQPSMPERVAQRILQQRTG